MRVMAIDIETTGLNFKTDKIVEVGYLVKEFKDHLWSPKNLAQGSFFLWDEEYPDPMPFTTYSIHKISSNILSEVGLTRERGFFNLFQCASKLKVECLIAHNGLAFDRPFILSQIPIRSNTQLRFFEDTPWIDTKVHIPYPDDCKSKSLMYLAAYHGFLNPFPHDALSDVQTMMKILQVYNFDKIYASLKTPWITIRAKVEFADRELARSRGYEWNRMLKYWEKTIPATDFKKEQTEAPFSVIEVIS